MTTNGWYYFYRSISTDRCTSAYYMIYGSTSSYRWSGFALGSGYYGLPGQHRRHHLQGRQRCTYA